MIFTILFLFMLLTLSAVFGCLRLHLVAQGFRTGLLRPFLWRLILHLLLLRLHIFLLLQRHLFGFVCFQLFLFILLDWEITNPGIMKYLC